MPFYPSRTEVLGAPLPIADPRTVESAVKPRPPHCSGEPLLLQLFSHLQVTPHPGVRVFPTTPQICLSFPPHRDFFPCVFSCRSFLLDSGPSAEWLLWNFQYFPCRRASLVAQSVRKLPAVQETQVRSLGQEDPLRRKWQATPGFFMPGEFHGQRSLGGYNPWGHRESDMTWQLNHHHLVGDELRVSLLGHLGPEFC